MTISPFIYQNKKLHYDLIYKIVDLLQNRQTDILSPKTPLYVQGLLLYSLTEYIPHNRGKNNTTILEKEIVQNLLRQFDKKTASWNYFNKNHPSYSAVPDDTNSTSLITIALKNYYLKESLRKNKTNNTNNTLIISVIKNLYNQISNDAIHTWYEPVDKKWENKNIVVQAQVLRALEYCGLTSPQIVGKITAFLNEEEKLHSKNHPDIIALYYLLSKTTNLTLQNKIKESFLNYLTSNNKKILELSLLKKACILSISKKMKIPEFSGKNRQFIKNLSSIFFTECLNNLFTHNHNEYSEELTCPFFIRSVTGEKYTSNYYTTLAICLEVLYEETLEQECSQTRSTSRFHTFPPLLNICRGLLRIGMEYNKFSKLKQLEFIEFLENWWTYRELIDVAEDNPSLTQQEKLILEIKCNNILRQCNKLIYKLNMHKEIKSIFSLGEKTGEELKNNTSEIIKNRLKKLHICMVPFLLVCKATKQKSFIKTYTSIILQYLEFRQAADDMHDLAQDLQDNHITLVTTYIYKGYSLKKSLFKTIQLMKVRLRKMGKLSQKIPHSKNRFIIPFCIKRAQHQIWQSEIQDILITKKTCRYPKT